MSCIFQFSFIDTRSADYAGTVFAYGVTSSGKTHTMHVSYSFGRSPFFLNFTEALLTYAASHTNSLGLFNC